MQNSKVLRLLATFSNKEWGRFTDFLHTPFFANRQELIALSRTLTVCAPNFESINKLQLWNSVYPQKELEEKQFNYLMAWLQDAAIQFLVTSRMDNQPTEREIAAAALFIERGLEKHFDFQVSRIRKGLDESAIRDSGYWHIEFRLLNLERMQHTRKETRRGNPFLQKGSNSLDRYYFSEKLKYACAMMNDQGIIASDYEFLFVEEILNYLTQQPYLLAEPSIAVYYHIWKLMTRSQDVEYHFSILKSLISSQKSCFSQEEGKDLYSYALNFCIGQIRLMKEEYVKEALHLYEAGIESGVLLTNQRLSPWHYKNIVRAGLRSGRFDWTQQFILDKNKLLDPEFREDALHFNLADLYFFTGKYKESITHLHQVEFTSVQYNLEAKEMLAKIYFETGEDDALFSLIHSFRTYLRRNKVISEQSRKAYLNFLKLLEQRISRSHDRLPELRTQIAQTEPLVAKNWLLERCV